MSIFSKICQGYVTEFAAPHTRALISESSAVFILALLIRRWNDRRNRGNEAVTAAATAVPTNSTKGATKRSKRVAQRLANEEPAPPPLKLPKLHLVLTRKEIQEDWLKITGHKYTGKPRKSTLIQRVCLRPRCYNNKMLIQYQCVILRYSASVTDCDREFGITYRSMPCLHISVRGFKLRDVLGG